MKGVHVKRIVRLTLTADDWQLYTKMDECEEVASDLNETIELAVYSGDDKHEVAWRAYQFMDYYIDYGTADPEPCGVLEDILDTIFD